MFPGMFLEHRNQLGIIVPGIFPGEKIPVYSLIKTIGPGIIPRNVPGIIPRNVKTFAQVCKLFKFYFLCQIILFLNYAN